MRNKNYNFELRRLFVLDMKKKNAESYKILALVVNYRITYFFVEYVVNKISDFVFQTPTGDKFLFYCK